MAPPKRDPSESPTADEVRAAREKAGLTQTDAAAVVYATLRGWQGWEAAEGKTHRDMPPGLFELFQIKTGQHRKFGSLKKE